jgi:hypothetical protein
MLAEEIKGLLQSVQRTQDSWDDKGRQLATVFELLGYELRLLEQFYDCFVRAATYSIDKFLENRPDLLNLGKLLIAYVLKQKENWLKLFIGLRKDNWYAELFNRLDLTVDNAAKSGISFITFNYDRSLTVFLHSALKNRTTKSTEAVLDALNAIPVVHVYGTLGNLPWSQQGGIPYDHFVAAEQLKRMGSQIDIMSAEAHAERWAEAHGLLAEATHIYFLGFGYDRVNLERLAIQEFTTNRDVRGTAFGIAGSRLLELQKFFGYGRRTSSGGLTQAAIRLTSAKTGIMEFLDEAVLFD